MFSIGDIIFYPVFGAGYISSIEEKEVWGEIKRYYIIKLLIDDMSMMVPIESVEARRIRMAISNEKCKGLFDIIGSPSAELSTKWGERYKYYSQRMRIGDIYSLATIIRDIAGLSKTRGLSKSEMKVLLDVLDMVSGEISLVTNRDIKAVKKEILNIVDLNNYTC